MGKLTLKCTSIKIIHEHVHLLGYDTVQLYLPNINYIPKESNYPSQGILMNDTHQLCCREQELSVTALCV